MGYFVPPDEPEAAPVLKRPSSKFVCVFPPHWADWHTSLITFPDDRFMTIVAMPPDGSKPPECIRLTKLDNGTWQAGELYVLTFGPVADEDDPAPPPAPPIIPPTSL